VLEQALALAQQHGDQGADERRRAERPRSAPALEDLERLAADDDVTLVISLRRRLVRKDIGQRLS